jgi:hypothetical protein
MNSSLAFNSAIDEIKSSYPQISNFLVFTNTGQIIAQDDTTSEEFAKQAISIFYRLKEPFENGNLEDVSISCDKGLVNVSHIEDCYVLFAYGKGVDEKLVQASIRIIFSTLMRMLAHLSIANLEHSNDFKSLSDPEKATLIGEEPLKPSVLQTMKINKDPESLSEKAPVYQFMAEKLKGILAPKDTIKIDKETIDNWNKLYEGKTVSKVRVENLQLEGVTCQIKPIKNGKLANKGVAEIPEEILTALRIARGDLVIIKPLIKSEEHPCQEVNLN